MRTYNSSFLSKRLLSLALVGALSPATSIAATSSATQLLQDFEAACQPRQILPPPGNDQASDFVQQGATDRRQARAATASPDSSFCVNLTNETDMINEMNGENEAALLAARADFAAAITPDEVPAMYTSLVQLSANQIRNVSQQLRGHRQSGKQGADSANRIELDNYVGGTAGSGAGRLSMFVDGARVDGDQTNTDFEVGYDLTTDHFTVGVDYRISNELIAGVAYGNSDTTLKYSEANNQTDNTSDHFLVYGSWYRDNFAVDSMLGYAAGTFDTRRNVPSSTATGSTDNSLIYFSIAGSYDFNSGGFTYGTFASLDVLDGKIDAFEESGGNGWEVAFSRQDVKSQIYAMGGHVNYAASFNWGVLIPHARAEWRTELENDRDFIVGRFVQDPSSSFTLQADDPDSSWFQVSAGVSAQLPHGIAVFLDYEEVLSYDNTDLRSMTLGMRWEM